MLRTRGAFIHRSHLPLCLNTSTIRFKAKDEADLRYLRFWLDSHEFRSQITRLVTGSAQQNFGPSHLESIYITLPDLPEQKRIANLLDQADQLRRTRRYALELSETFLPAAFLEMFGAAPPEMYALERVAIDERGAFVNGPFGSDLLTSELFSTGVPVIYIRDISAGLYQRTSTVCVTPEKAKELSIFRVTPGDVLIVKVGDPPGTSAIYPADQPIGVITQDVIRIKPDRDIITPEYLVSFLNSRIGFNTLRPIIVEGTRARFGLTPFKELSIPVPSLPLQQKFAALVRQHERLRAGQHEALRQAEHLFQTLLHRAFNGGV